MFSYNGPPDFKPASFDPKETWSFDNGGCGFIWAKRSEFDYSFAAPLGTPHEVLVLMAHAYETGQRHGINLGRAQLQNEFKRLMGTK